MTRSLVVLDRLPYPPIGGQQLRYRQAIEALRGLGPVSLLLLGRPSGAKPPGCGLIAADPEVARSGAYRWAAMLGPRGKQLLRARLRARHLARLRLHLASQVERLAPDLVLVASAELAGYLPPLRAAGRLLVYDAHNVERLLWGELVPLRAKLGEAPGSSRFRERIVDGEAALAAAVDEVWVCSAEDRQLFARTYPTSRARVRVVPNAVDTARLGAIAGLRAAERPPGPPTVLFAANFDYAPNVEAAWILLHEVRPRLREMLPTARFVLCGRRPPEELRAEPARDSDVVVTGEVADVGPWLAACDAVAVPLRHGGGTRIKILEALAAGCPVVSTRKGAEGLDLEDGRHLRLAETPADMAAALRWCILEPAAARAMAHRGGDRVEALYSWRANAGRVRRAVSEVTGEAALRLAAV